MFDRLMLVREEAELKQSELANIIKVDRSNISKWENGKEFIPLRHLNEYANHFNVSLDYLLGLSKDRNYHRIINKDIDKKIVGIRLKKIREKNNLTLRELAKILNTTSSTLSAYETGKVLILTSFAYEICFRFNISLDYLCGKVDGILIKL